MMKKILVGIVVAISLLALFFRFGGEIGAKLNATHENAGVRVLSLPSEATVFINDKEVGKTPYQDEQLNAGEYLVKIQSGEAVWQGSVKLNAGTLSVVNRDLAKDTTSSAGEVLLLKKGKGITMVSFPSESEIEVDGKYYGKTPTTLEIGMGEHTFGLSKPGYLKRSVKAYLPEGYNLTLAVDLAISEVDLTSITTPPITETAKVVVKNTPTGFLRVRDNPSVSGKEVGKVSPGDRLILLEELTGWDRIRMDNGTEGFVSNSYVSKVSSSPAPK